MNNLEKNIETTVVSNELFLRESIIKTLIDIQSVVRASKPHMFVNEEKTKMSFWSPSSVNKNSLPGFDSIIKRMILDACEKSERCVHGTSEITLAFCTMLSLEMMKEIASGKDFLLLVKKMQDDSGAFQKSILGVTKEITGKAIHGSIKELSLHPKIASLAMEAIEIGGLESKYIVDKNTSKTNCTIERSDGHSFDVQPYVEFVGQNNWNKENVKIVIIDGMIENVAEISKLLHQSNEERSKIVIFARAFAEEVISTLAVNMARGTLEILPVRVPFDENSANILKDIAIVTNSDLISSLKGDLISSIKHESLKDCKRLIATNKSVTIYTNKTSPSLNGHLNDLKIKKSKCESDILGQMLDRRIKSLLSTTVTVNLNDSLFDYAIDLDVIFSEIGAFIKNGYIELNEIKKLSPKTFDLALDELIKIKKTAKIPVISLIAAITYSLQTAISIASINTAILVEN